MDAQTAPDVETLLERWHELANDPDSPDRYELDEHGKLIVSPRPTSDHQILLGIVADQIKAQLGGYIVQELPMLTRSAGVRCPDVSWVPEHLFGRIRGTSPAPIVPPLVVEVLSPGNRKKEIEDKTAAYLESGAQEVIAVALNGQITFYRRDGAHEESAFGVKFALPPELFN